METLIRQAAMAVRDAEALLIAAGAGMGVDSGLPDFRGQQGFWRAYPEVARLGLSFAEMANPAWFIRDARLAWAFYGHRLNLYRHTTPHAGFARLRTWADQKPYGAFVFTSNVDGHFQRAGFALERLTECHGSIHHLQCVRPCRDEIWSAEETVITVDEEAFRAMGRLPACPFCGELARPNILMFGDVRWIPDRSAAQEARLNRWLESVREARARLTILELGAGTAVPSVRLLSEAVAEDQDTTLIRINPREPEVPFGQISLPLGAAEALERMESASV